MTLNIRKQEGPRLGRVSMLLYGMPKVGKTAQAARFPKPLFLSCEPGGTDYLSGVDVVDIGSLSELAGVLSALLKAADVHFHPEPLPYRTLVVDGFTWLVNRAVERAAEGQKEPRQAFQAVTRQVGHILDSVMQWPGILVVTGHSRSRQVDENGGRATKIETRPDLNPALADDVFGIFDIVAYAYAGPSGGVILTKPVDTDRRRILAGDRSGRLPRTMTLDATAILAALKGEQAS